MRILVLMILLMDGAAGQAPCPVSISPPADKGRDLFTLAQETDLGDAIAESQFTDLRILAEGDAHLQQIAARLAQNTPLASLPIRTFIVDIPEANAFVIPGGRIYVSRAMLAVMESDDELAGILAHEMGHLLAHQQAISVSRLMKATLGISSLGSRRDVFDHFARMLENEWRKPALAGRSVDRDEKDQMEADRLGLAMQTAAGFDPQAQVRALDRLLQTKGKTGSFLGNLFDSNPDQKRLGELVKNLPVNCRSGHQSSNVSFLEWRKSLQGLSSPHYAEALPPAQLRVTLQSPLRDDLRKISFSPDGQWLLAQDDAGITVLKVDPFTVAFRIPAENVSEAGFTPDSREVVFLSSATHVERWNVAGQERSGSAEILTREPCAAELLSPDGRILACYEREGTLRLLEVGSGAVLFEKKDFGAALRVFPLEISFSLLRADTALARTAFSPDGRYFLALPLDGVDRAIPICLDLTLKAAVSLRGGLKKLSGHRFVFLDSGRLMMSPIAPNAGADVTATVVRFPSGEVLSTPTVPSAPLYRATNPEYIIVRPLGKFAAVAIEYASGKGVTSKVPAMDFYGRFHAVERVTGELALYDSDNKAVATARLPEAELIHFRSFALAPDMSWMAASVRSRGALWNLPSGRTVAGFVAFDGGYFDAQDHLLADVPQFNDAQRHMVDINPNPLGSVKGLEIKDSLARQVGPYIVDMQSEDGAPLKFFNETGTFEKLTLTIRDARTMKTIWSRHFEKEAPQFFFDASAGKAIFLWTSTSDRVRHDARLKGALGLAEENARKDERNCSLSDFFLHATGSWGGTVVRSGLLVAEIVDLASGAAVGEPVTVNLVDRCLAVKAAAVAGGSLVIEDTIQRVLVFAPGSLNPEASQPRLRLFGHLADADDARHRIAVGKEAGRLVIYDAASGDQITEFKFPAPLLAVRFAGQGRLLFALTARHEAITLALP